MRHGNLISGFLLTILFAKCNFSSNDSYYEGLGFNSSISNNNETTTNITNATGESDFLDPMELVSQVELLTDLITLQLEIGDGSIIEEIANLTLKGLADLTGVSNILSDTGDAIKPETLCAAIQILFGSLLYQARRPDSSEKSLITFVTFICTTFKIAVPEVCDGLVNRLFPTIYWIVNQKPKISPPIVTGIIGQSFGCVIPRRDFLNSDFNWNIDTLRNLSAFNNLSTNSSGYKRAEISVKSSKDFRNLQISKQKKIMKILQLTDLHIDFEYKKGTEAECDNNILCCHEKTAQGNKSSSSNSTTVNVAAGYFGDNRKCDTPKNLLRMTLEHIRTEHKDIDLIYMTGDLVPHNIWYTNQQENSRIIQQVSKIIYEYFPNSTVIPCLGNHEVHPINFYSPTSKTYGSSSANPIPENLRTDWVYEVAYESWSQWIPPDQKDTFLSSGNYAVEINSKFRVLVINSNVCYVENIWQLYDPVDPGRQLEWLYQQLELTKSENKTAHIIGHVPPGHEDCFKTWSREFYKIISRFHKVVRGQFYGHMHFDEFKIFHNPENKTEPTNVLWISPSLTPYSINNPAYRIYHADLGFMHTFGDIVDLETWVYDLELENREYLANPKANNDQVKWFKLYQATEAYQIENLLPSSLKQFVIRMAKDPKAFDLFYRYYHKSIDPKVKEPCDTICKKKILCTIVQSYYDDDEGHTECDSIQMEVDGEVSALNLSKQNIKSWM